MKPVTMKWFKYLIAIILGNVLYFALNPYLPEAARHHTYKLDLGTLVDFWFSASWNWELFSTNRASVERKHRCLVSAFWFLLFLCGE
jgi:hypothetical protein